MPEAKKILLTGAGGHCMSVLDSILLIGIINRNIKSADHQSIMGVPVSAMRLIFLIYMYKDIRMFLLQSEVLEIPLYAESFTV